MKLQPICKLSEGYIQRYLGLERVARYRDKVLRQAPELKNLFFELTEQCNERCRHCGSFCGAERPNGGLSPQQWMEVVDQVAEDFPQKPLLCITGGEPLLYPELCQVMGYAAAKGFRWGMTTNGTLITPKKARELALAGMRTVSVSIDGLEEYHDWFRQSPGGFRRALEGVKALVAEGFEHVQVTTVVTRKNIDTLEELYELVKGLGVRSWRVINMEPMGRALELPELLLSPEDYRRLFTFIVEKRRTRELEVAYGCSHYLGPDLEHETRPWHFVCGAGVMTASITATGEVLSCLDLPRRPELVEGNVLERRFSEIWREGYTRYRSDWRRVGKCAQCREYKYCAGDSFHSWDFDKMEPMLCFKGILF